MAAAPRQLIFVWQWIILAAIAWNAFEVPFSYFFNLQINPFVLCVDILMALLFLGDLVFNPLKSSERRRSSKILYIVACLSVIPFDLLAKIVGLDVLEVCQLVRLGLFFKLRRRINEFQIFVHYARFFRLITIIISLLVMFNLIACLAYNFGITKLAYETGLYAQYIESLYWTVTTLTTVGYGDLTPVTLSAKIFTIIVMMLGVAFYGFILGVVSKLFLHYDKYAEKTREKLVDILHLMDYYKLPRALQTEIYTYYQHHLGRRLSDTDERIINELPEKLQLVMRSYKKATLLRRVFAFSNYNEKTLFKIGNALENKFYGPGDYIFKKGDIGTELYIVRHGVVRVVDEEGKTLNTLKKGQYFGEVALLRETKRIATVIAVTYCDLSVLRKQDFLKVMDEDPKLLEEFQQKMKRY